MSAGRAFGLYKLSPALASLLTTRRLRCRAVLRPPCAAPEERVGPSRVLATRRPHFAHCVKLASVVTNPPAAVPASAHSPASCATGYRRGVSVESPVPAVQRRALEACIVCSEPSIVLAGPLDSSRSLRKRIRRVHRR